MRRADVLRQSPPIFQSRVLERLTRTHPLVPFALYAPAIAALATLGVPRAGLLPGAGDVLAGYVGWTLTEYWVHRCVFHFRPVSGFGRRLHWVMHGLHHEHPADRDRLVFPPAASVPLALLVLGGFRLGLGERYWMAFAAGFLAGYLVYDLLHYHVHHDRPRSRVGRWLRARHLRHHFQDDRSGFGVSAPYWDRVFGTAPGSTAPRSTAPARSRR
jgi:dihydroceramide fatty acyl 2-hydroxylase